MSVLFSNEFSISFLSFRLAYSMNAVIVVDRPILASPSLFFSMLFPPWLHVNFFLCVRLLVFLCNKVPCRCSHRSIRWLDRVWNKKKKKEKFMAKSIEDFLFPFFLIRKHWHFRFLHCHVNLLNVNRRKKKETWRHSISHSGTDWKRTKKSSRENQIVWFDFSTNTEH